MRRLLPLLFFACTQDPAARPVQVAATALALDATTVEITFSERLESFDEPGLLIQRPFARPVDALPISGVIQEESKLRLSTGRQIGGEVYAVTLPGLRFTDVEVADAPSQVNFIGFGTTSVVVSLDARGHVTPPALELLVTIDPNTGEYRDELARFPLVEGPAQVYSATISARIDVGRRYGARAVGSDGRPAAQLSVFQVASADVVQVGLTPVLPRVPEFSPPTDPTPGDGKAPVRLILDDRPGRALRSPSLRLSVDSAGRFDPSAARVEPLRVVPGKSRVFEVVVEVAVDVNRSLEGTSADTFPYVTFLVQGGEDLPQRGTTFEMKTETPQVIIIPIGNPALVPVTFRADIGRAYLEPDGSLFGLYPGEGLFLTGEFPSAEDALGRLAADAFTGGERATLEMEERPDAPGIYEKTIFLPPKRPYGWKVVRCPTLVGCAELNRHVLSSGRAFPTVMKNLVTANRDAAGDPAVKVLDPANLQAVALDTGPADYRNARVSNNGEEAASPAVMFKQEAPDLVVTVDTTPVVTPIVVVGTWRDVNIPQRPSELIASGDSLDLGPFDYDDGTQGRLPPLRDLELPLDPGAPVSRPGQPAFDATDGVRDTVAFPIYSDPELHLAWNEEELYVATTPAAPGTDRFIVIGFDPPDTTRAAHWAKGGQVAVGPRQVFLAMEGDGGFVGWFRYGATPAADVQLMGNGVTARSGAVLEGTVNLAAAGLGQARDRIWVTVLSYQTTDGGNLSAQSPAGNGDLDLSANELAERELSSIRAN